MNSLFLRLVVLLLLLCTSTQYSKGCDCIMTPIKQHIKTTKYIVLGKVKTVFPDSIHYPFPIRNDGGGHEIIFIIKKSFKWRGKIKKEIEIRSDFSNCDFYYKKGEEYVLFLYKKRGVYHLRQCSYSSHFEHAEDVIAVLENQ